MRGGHSADYSITGDTRLDASGFNKGLSAMSVAAGNLISGLTQAATGKLTELAKTSVGVGMSFQSSMSQVAATMGVGVDQIQSLTDKAKEMGSTTAFTATQAADALNYLALAGYDANKAAEVLPSVLNLAAAGGMDLPMRPIWLQSPWLLFKLKPLSRTWTNSATSWLLQRAMQALQYPSWVRPF